MITFETISSPEKAEELRVLRNECSEWMTKDTSKISKRRQRKFFKQKILTGKIEGFLLYDNGKPAAYGLVVWDDEGRAWSSTGVKTSSRGRGHGRNVTIEVVNRARAYGVPTWAEVRCDNAGQQRICRSVGYVVVDTFERDGLTIDLMRCDKLDPGYL